MFLLLLVGMLAAGLTLHSVSATSAALSIPSVTKNPVDNGTFFTVPVQIGSVSDLFGFDINITWNNTLITFSSLNNAPLNTIWPQGFFEPFYQIGSGFVDYAAAATGGTGFTGSGILYNLTFQIVYTGNFPTTTPIQFYAVKLSDSQANPITATLNNGTYTMNPIAYTLTTSIIGGGSITLNNTGPYHYGDTVLLTAVPSPGWTFNAWSGDLTGPTNPTTLTITHNMTATATFVQNNYSLTVSVVGGGFVRLNNTGPIYHYGDVVLLTAVPYLGWSFINWSGNLIGSTNPGRLVIIGNMIVTATFTGQDQYVLTVITIGGGSVSVSPAQASYINGTIVALNASANVGWSFAGWSGDAFGGANPTYVDMTRNETVTATFTPNVYTLTLFVNGSGTISLNKTGFYSYGDAVQLWASAQTGSNFDHWSGDLSGTVNPATIVMTGNFSITATFIAGPPDLAVINVTSYKTVIGQTYSGNINVIVENVGGYPETFNVTVYVNGTYVASQNVTNLTSGNSANVLLAWNTTGFAYGNYTISAYAWPVPGETDTANNNCTGNNVIVSIPGDINGDFKVTLQDLVLLAVAYGTTPASGGTPGTLHAWNPNADIDNNGAVGLPDLVILATHYGRHYP